MKRPLVGVTADYRTYDSAPYHVVGDKYLRAVWEAAGCTPMIIPARNSMHGTSPPRSTRPVASVQRGCSRRS